MKKLVRFLDNRSFLLILMISFFIYSLIFFSAYRVIFLAFVNEGNIQYLQEHIMFIIVTSTLTSSIFVIIINKLIQTRKMNKHKKILFVLIILMTTILFNQGLFAFSMTILDHGSDFLVNFLNQINDYFLFNFLMLFSLLFFFRQTLMFFKKFLSKAEMLQSMKDSPNTKEKIFFHLFKLDKEYIFEPEQIDYIYSHKKNKIACINNDSFFIKETIESLENKLRLFNFIRINRSVIVNRAYIKEIKKEYLVKLKNNETFKVSSSKAYHFDKN